MVFLRPPVLCDGSKRQTTAFDRYSHPASPPRDTTPVFSFHNCYLSMTTFMVVARSFRCPGVAAVTFFRLEAARLKEKKKLL